MNERIAISVAEAAVLLGVSRPTMYEIIKRDDFKGAFKLGSRTLISRSDLEAWVKAQTEAQE